VYNQTAHAMPYKKELIRLELIEVTIQVFAALSDRWNALQRIPFFYVRRIRKARVEYEIARRKVRVFLGKPPERFPDSNVAMKAMHEYNDRALHLREILPQAGQSVPWALVPRLLKRVPCLREHTATDFRTRAPQCCRGAVKRD
jgi:hypothetical protein